MVFAVARINVKTLLAISVILITLVLTAIGCGSGILMTPANTVNAQPKGTTLIPITLGETNQLTPKIFREYTWLFSGIQWRWHINIPKSVYDYYSGIPRYVMTSYSAYITHPKDDYHFTHMTREINRIAEAYGFSDKDKVEFTAAFVQSFDYATDLNTTGYEDYTKFPIETLVHQRGDCEDTSILLASLLDGLDIETALVYFPTTIFDIPHMGIGISSVDGTYGTHWEYNGQKYYFIETTTKGLRIGAIPGEWSQILPEILPLMEIPYLSHDYAVMKEEGCITVSVNVTNIGTISAGAVVIYLFYYPDDDLPDDLITQSDSFTQKSTVNNISAGDSITTVFRFPIIEGYGPIFIRITSSNAIVE